MYVKTRYILLFFVVFQATVWTWPQGYFFHRFEIFVILYAIYFQWVLCF